ncbi:MAG: hypothetical protein HYW01_05205 [Deltaproteobacteria bacterium]|nr:hypothetical protein [Deltaproteobacteria bacterium]
MMMQIVVVGLSYKNTLVEIREKFSFIQPTLEIGFAELHKKGNIEVCLLSTCNRNNLFVYKGIQT